PIFWGTPRRTGRLKICSASSGIPSRMLEPPVITTPEAMASSSPDLTLARFPAADAGYLDLVLFADESGQAAAVFLLDLLGFRHGGAQPDGDIIGQVVAAQ